MQRDTSGWRTQVWISFAAAIGSCAYGVLLLPSQELDRAFSGHWPVFLPVCFIHRGQNHPRQPRWTGGHRWLDHDRGQASLPPSALTAWGLWRMAIEDWQKAYMVVSWLFLVSATFTVAKTVRDKHEADLMHRGAVPPDMQDTIR